MSMRRKAVLIVIRTDWSNWTNTGKIYSSKKEKKSMPASSGTDIQLKELSTMLVM